MKDAIITPLQVSDVRKSERKKSNHRGIHSCKHGQDQGNSFIEFFAGIGLVHLGLVPLDWKCVYANDIDPKKKVMYEAQFGEAGYYHVEDVWNTEAIIKQIPGKSQLATASFPCVDLSLAGNRRGLAGKQSGTFYGFIEVLKRLASEDRLPDAVMVENVMGFLTSHGGSDFISAINALAKLGYFVDSFVVDAKFFTPQSRTRLFIIGCRREMLPKSAIREPIDFQLGDPWEEALMQRPDLRPEVLIRVMRKTRIATGWVLFQMPELGKENRTVSGIIDISEGEAWWAKDLINKHLSEMSARHRAQMEKMRSGSSFAVGTIYRRIRNGGSRSEIRVDGLAGCLRTPRGGSSKQIVYVAGQGTIRMRWMSPREYARLQGAPDFPITVGRNQALFGFGDAVCVPVISWIGEHVLSNIFCKQS